MIATREADIYLMTQEVGKNGFHLFCCIFYFCAVNSEVHVHIHSILTYIFLSASCFQEKVEQGKAGRRKML